jgi:hypothetical protein
MKRHNPEVDELDLVAVIARTLKEQLTWSIYIRAELQILVAQNRVAPLTQAELRKVHEIKRTFGARTTK